MRKTIFLLAAALISAGCHGQVPPASTHVVDVTWTAPTATAGWTGCTTTAPCVYAVYRCTDTAANCASTSSTSWKEITTPASRPSSTSFTDSNAAGLTAYYNVETVQGSANSAPSNTVGPLTVPAAPGAPSLGNPAIASNSPERALPQESQLAKLNPVSLMARVR